jgi:hypothetical protein
MTSKNVHIILIPIWEGSLDTVRMSRNFKGPGNTSLRKDLLKSTLITLPRQRHGAARHVGR